MLGYNHKFLPTIYTAVIAIIATSAVLTFFYSVGLQGVLPILPSFILALSISIVFSLLFKERIIKAQLKGRGFLLGVGILLLSLPLFDIGAVFFIKSQFQGTQIFHSTITEYFQLYLMILVYSFIFVGSWLSILCGFTSTLFKRLFQNLPDKPIFL